MGGDGKGLDMPWRSSNCTQQVRNRRKFGGGRRGRTGGVEGRGRRRGGEGYGDRGMIRLSVAAATHSPVAGLLAAAP